MSIHKIIFIHLIFFFFWLHSCVYLEISWKNLFVPFIFLLSLFREELTLGSL